MSIFIKKYKNKTSKSNDSNNEKKSNSSHKKQIKCVNPIFEKWLIELRDDAIARDLQSKHTYTKVYEYNKDIKMLMT